MNKISSLIMALGLALSLPALAQDDPPPANEDVSPKPALKVSDLPVVKRSQEVRRQFYPNWSSETPPSLPSFPGLREGLRPSPVFSPPSVINTIRQEMARAVSLVGEQEIQQALENDPNRWKDIIGTVNLFANEKAISFEPREKGRELERTIGTLFIKSMDPWRLLFSREEVNRLLADHKGIHAAVEGTDLRWIERIGNMTQERQRAWLVSNRDILGQYSALDGLPRFCPRHRKWENNPEGFVRSDRLELQRRAGLCDDLSGRLAKIEKSDTKALEKLFESMAKEYDELVQGAARQSTQIPYVAFLSARLAVLDPHSAYIPASGRTDMAARMMGAYVGIGVTTMYKGSSVSFAQVAPDGPAFEAGIRSGDALLAIGPTIEQLRPVEEFNSIEITSMLSGIEGGTVALRIRDSKGVVSEKTVRRRRISINDDRIKVSKIKDGDLTVLHIRVSGFYEDRYDPERPGGSTAADLRRALESSDDHDWVLLDLRRNGGGMLSQAVRVSGLFLPPGPIVQLESPAGKTTTLTSEEEPLWTGPLALLVDRYAASASEITAAALQDRGRAVILGERTFGKGTAQQQYDLDRWAGSPASVYGYLNLTSLRFFRPSGQTTQLLGVEPDIAFIPEEGPGRESDKLFVLKPTTLPSLLVGDQSSPYAHCYADIQQQARQTWANSTWASAWARTRQVHTQRSIDVHARRQEIEQQRKARDDLAKAVEKLVQKDAPLSLALTSLSLLNRCILPSPSVSTSPSESL